MKAQQPTAVLQNVG